MIRLSILVPCWNQEALVVKALDSIPRRDDIEVIARDDGSTDSTFAVLLKYQERHKDLNLTVLHEAANHGCAYNCNRLLEHCHGEYFHFLANDDYLLTDEYLRVMEHLGEADEILLNLRINDGTVFRLNMDTHRLFCAQSTRFIRTAIANGVEFPEHITGPSDWFFNEELEKRKPTKVFTGITAYHYNFPREGSLSDLIAKGIIKG